jgi:DNA-binding LacI/PurR family transcriptional regulator
MANNTSQKYATVERQSEEYLYRQIYEILLKEINAGFYSAEGKLPSEMMLKTRFGVERNTVRKALQILAMDRRIVKVPGYGAKIATDPSLVRKANSERHSLVALITQEDYLRGGDGEYFHFKLIHSLMEQFASIGFQLVFKTVGAECGVEWVMQELNPTALIFNSYNAAAFYQEAISFGIPCISVNHYTPLMTSVVSNNYDGAFQAAEALVVAGHTKIAYITGKRNYQTTIERLSGIQGLYQSRQLVLQDKYIFTGDWLFASGVSAADRICDMKKADRPTAIFAFNDDMAYGCLSRLTQRGLTVPGDISLIGFDKSDKYKDMFAPITTVDVNLDAMVQYACWYLSGRIAKTAPETCAKIMIDATLVDNGTILIHN